MSHKSLQILINDVREATEESDFNSSTGIQDSEFIRFLNQGQNLIYRKIISKSQKLFSKTIDIPIASEQKTLAMPKDIYAKNRITDIKFIESDVIYQVQAASEKEDLFFRSATPSSYYRRNNEIVFIPAPRRSGEMRLSYIYKIPDLAFKAASVGSVVLENSTITSLNFNVTTDDINSDALTQFTRFSIVDEEGNVKMSNIKFTAIDTGSGLVTIDPSFTFNSNESISVGDIVVPGPLSSTHSALESDVEEYIVEYATLKILQRQGSAETATQAQVLLALESDIMDVYGRIDDDTRRIPLIQDRSEDFDW